MICFGFFKEKKMEKMIIIVDEYIHTITAIEE